MSDDSLIVLCPLCGSEIHLSTRMGKIVSDPTTRMATISIEAIDVEHHCPEEDGAVDSPVPQSI